MKSRINLEAKKTLFVISHGPVGLLDISGSSLTCSVSYFFKSKDLLGGSGQKQNTECSIFVLSWLESGKGSKKKTDICLASFFSNSRRLFCKSSGLHLVNVCRMLEENQLF